MTSSEGPKKNSKALLITAITLSVTLHAVGIYVLFDRPFSYLASTFSPFSAVMSPDEEELSKEKNQFLVESFNQLIHFKRQHLPLFESTVNIETNLQPKVPYLQPQALASATLEEKFIITNQFEKPTTHYKAQSPITGMPQRKFHSCLTTLSKKNHLFQAMNMDHDPRFIKHDPESEFTTALAGPEELTIDGVPPYQGKEIATDSETTSLSDSIYALSHDHAKIPLYFPKTSFAKQDADRKSYLLDHQIVINMPLHKKPLIAKVVPHMHYPHREQHFSDQPSISINESYIASVESTQPYQTAFVMSEQTAVPVHKKDPIYKAPLPPAFTQSLDTPLCQSLPEQGQRIFVEDHPALANYNHNKVAPEKEMLAFDPTSLFKDLLTPELKSPEHTSEVALNIEQTAPILQTLHNNDVFVREEYLNSFATRSPLIDRMSIQYPENQAHIAASDYPTTTPNREEVAELEQLNPAMQDEHYVAVPSVSDQTIAFLEISPNQFAMEDLERESINKHQFDTEIDNNPLAKIGKTSPQMKISELIINHFVAVVPYPMMEVEEGQFDPVSLDDIYAVTKKFEEMLAEETLAFNAESEDLNIDEVPQAIHDAPHLKQYIAREQVAGNINREQRITFANLARAPNILYEHVPVIYEDAFKTQLKIAPSIDGKGYLFSLALTPNKTLDLAPINQNFTFIIDRSGTIQKHRYNIFRKGVIKALSYLKEGDQFNIVIVDTKIVKMSPHNVQYNKNSLATAIAFINQQEYSGYFKDYNPFKVFETLTDENSRLPQTFVYLSDGTSLTDIHKDKHALAMLMQENFSLFTAAASHKNNLPMLELIASMNKGELMHSPTHAAFPRKLSHLVKHVDRIIAKEMRINILTADTDTHVEILPNESHLPDFYLDRPYIVYGMVDDLSDFDLHIQGKMNGEIFAVNQRVSFEDAEETGYQLQKKYSAKQAQVCYEYYLKDSNPFYLTEAKKILEPFNIDLPVNL